MKKPTDLNISPKHQQQLERARRRGSSEFFEKVIISALGAAQNGQVPGYPHLYYRTDGNFSDQEMDEILEASAGEDDDNYLVAVMEATELFTNPLGPADFEAYRRVPGKFSGWTPPNQRVVNAGWMVLTFEYDGDDRSDLEMQLDWFAGKAENCQFAKVHKALCGHADYRGYCAVFSGHKSVHIHTVWDIRHLSKDLVSSAPRSVQKLWSGDIPDRDLIGLHRIVWAEVAAIINRELCTNLTFDTGLQSYVQKRRSPGGIRRITKAGNLHGFAIGDDIEQVVLQERMLSRSPADAGPSPLISFEKSRSITQFSRDALNIPSRRAVDPGQSDAVISLLQNHLRQQGWDEYPKPVRIDFDGTNNLLFFKNDAADVHPNTLVRGDYRRLLGAGRGTHVGDLFLPNDLTLDETLDLLVPPGSKQMQDQDNYRAPRLAVGKDRFPMMARDKKSARAEASRILDQVSQGAGLVLVQAPEGTGKTYALFNSLVEQRWDADAERFQNAIHRDDPPTRHLGFTIIACASHEQVYEKRDELLDVSNPPASVVVLRSVSQLYRTALTGFKGMDRITAADAGRYGFTHLLQAIQAQQPQVYAKMKDLRDDAWRGTDGEVRFRDDAVVLLVHDLLKVWPHAEFTKAFLHPNFPDDLDQKKVRECAKQMQPYRVIYDEVAWHDLAKVVPESQVDLAWSIRDACEASTGKEWDQSPLPDRVAAYTSGMTTVPKNDDNADLTYEDIDGLIRLKLQAKHRHTVDTKRYPFGKGTDEFNIYAKTHGDAYYCKALRWPRSLGCPVIILTTEDLPRLIAKGINRDNSKSKFSIINLTDTPHLFRDTVPLVFDERARMPRKDKSDSKLLLSVKNLAVELLDDGFDFVISDGLGGIDQSLRGQVSSHRSARGRNDLEGQRIATILTYPGPSQYSELAILGAAFDIDDPVSTALRDTVYQDLGRNLGFRYTPGQPMDSHVVIIKPSLFRNLNRLSGQSNPNIGHDRYLFQIVPK